MSVQHAFDLLGNPPEDAPAVAAVFGSDSTLRSWSIAELTKQGDLTQFEGDSVKWSDLRDDLSTASLFDFGEKRTIVVRSADKFVSEHRPEIEKHVADPGTASRLILELSSLAANTRLYKSLAKDHVLVACSPSTDKKLKVTAASRRKFLTGYVAARHKTKLANPAADALIEMLGEDIGMIDTEIAKLALYCDEGESITDELVRDIVAGWQGKTVWQITAAIAEGNAAEAMKQLDKLMSGGQRPIALLPQIAWSLRRLGLATAVVLHSESQGRRPRLEDALSSAGVKPYELQQAKAQLQGLGRDRAKQLLGWLLDADLRLKGTHSQEGRDRFLLEQFVIKLARE